MSTTLTWVYTDPYGVDGSLKASRYADFQAPKQATDQPISIAQFRVLEMVIQHLKHGVIFLQDLENQMDIAEKRRMTLLKDFLSL